MSEARHDVGSTPTGKDAGTRGGERAGPGRPRAEHGDAGSTVEPGTHERALLVYCYRLLASFRDAEVATRVTLDRARHDGVRASGEIPLLGLYRRATVACLQVMERPDRVAVVVDDALVGDGHAVPDLAEVGWLEPFPDALLQGAVRASATRPSGLAGAVELAFVAALQLLPPRPRAALVIRDVMGWSEEDTARVLGSSAGAVREELALARRGLRYRPAGKPAWPPTLDAPAAERQLVRAHIRAHEGPDVAFFESVIRKDALFRVPHDPATLTGRDRILRVWVEAGLGSGELGQLRCLPTRANLQPAIATYALRPGAMSYGAYGLDVLRVEDGMISEIVAFPSTVFAAFGLPDTM